MSKVAAVHGFGGEVQLDGDSVDHCVERAREHAEETGAVFVHPFDDPDVIVGQGTLGLELLEAVDDLATLVIPLGGGGLISGVAGVVKAARPDVRVIGVQVEACAPYPASLAAGEPPRRPPPTTIADGIAIKRPGSLTLPLVARLVDDVVVVPDDDVAEAMVTLMERAKLVVEGGGAVGVAALLTGAVQPAATGATVVVLSGGNVDAGCWPPSPSATRPPRAGAYACSPGLRPPGRAGRTAHARRREGGNLMTVEHVRDAVSLHVRQTGVALVLETRGADHADQIVAALKAAGYEVERLAP